MSVQIYQDPDFKIYKAGDGYIVHNRHKEFKNGHTHVRKYDTCMVMIKLVEKKLIPKSRSKHFIESLIRISNDMKYIRQIMTYI
ncbi:hypothetical protein HGI79_11290 [Clostridium sp. DJ247]|nr:hypothetical protein [Clostridium sp. DJ247]MBC2580863.1 hypothetical protein [Clostridium sp. DJ247]